jgi:DNA-binding response OmpR family regulator
MVADLLGGMNYNVITASDGYEAIDKLKTVKDPANPSKEPIDLVILDMILPEIDGKETYRRLKEIDPNVKVLLSTGYDVDDKVSEVLSDGAIGFIQKPYHIDKLVGLVKEHLAAASAEPAGSQ